MTIHDDTGELRVFVDALRVCLGLAPLYNQESDRTTIDRFLQNEQAPPWDPKDAHYVRGIGSGADNSFRDSDFMHRDRGHNRKSEAYYRRSFVRGGYGRRAWKAEQ